MRGQDGRERLDWRAGLKAADPLNVEAGMSMDDARVMRRVVAAATGDSRTADWEWPRPLAVAMTIAATLALGIVIGRQLPSRDVVMPKAPTVERRQMQFETPGGTRIIWTFSSDFDL